MDPLNTANINLKTELKAFQLMFVTIAGSVIIFALVAFGISSVKDMFIPALASTEVFIIMAVLAVVSLLIAFSIYRKGISNLPDAGTTLQNRIIAYRRVNVKFLAFCEAPAMLAAVLFMLSKSFNLSVIIIICVGAMLSKWPTRQRMENDLKLDWKEQQEF